MDTKPDPGNIEALTSFLILDHLEKAGIPTEVRKQLSEEMAKKGLFQDLISFSGHRITSSYEDLQSQMPSISGPVLKNLVSNQYQIIKKKNSSKQEIDRTISDIQLKYDILGCRARRDRLKRKIKSQRGYIPSLEYSPEIFTQYWGRLKSLFGHIKKDNLDPEDPINGSPVYNLIYDKTGAHVISAADDGIVKIWSTTNGELVNTLLGHTSDINATALSECGTYLASCSNDKLVRLWRLETGVPIAAFDDHNGIVCSLNFFSVPVYNNGVKTVKKGLASASEDGTIKIYFEEDFINNGGLRMDKQKHLTLKVEGNHSKGFSSIEFHPDGFIAAGTNWGSIVIWNKLPEIDLKHIERHRIIKNEHSKDCHLTLWNKQGTMLLTASFDGTAKVWPWNSRNFDANRETESMFIFNGELGKGTGVKCCAVAWSCRGRYAVASFCKKSGKRNEDTQIQSNIQVYDSKTNRRAHKFDKTYDGALFENYVFILEPHPFNEAILMSADYDGKIILWDVERGVMLNCFIENCAHMGCPLLQAPILDGRFSPDGLSFCVANYYGSITIYGYGERDLFLTTPPEQFYTKEFTKFTIEKPSLRAVTEDGTDMYAVDKGMLCSSKKRIYGSEETMEVVPEFNEEEFYKKYLQCVEKMRYLGTHEIEGINSKDCFKALKVRLHEIVQKEIETALELHSLDMMQSRNFSSTYGLIDTESLWYRHKEKQKEIEHKHKEHENTAARGQDRAHLDQQIALQDFMFEGSDYNPSDDDRPPVHTLNTSRVNTNNRRTRSSRRNRNTMEEELDIEEEEALQEIMREKMDDEDEEEEGQRLRSRRTRRLILDDDEEEPEQREREERRPLTRRVETRLVSGRRNRQLVNEVAHVREATTIHHNLRASHRNRPQLQMEEELGNDASCARCGLENARVKCGGACDKVYHTMCSKRHGKETEYGGFMCFPCLLKKRRTEKATGAHINRQWAGMESSQEGVFVPQVGDLVTYVFQAHEEFIVAYYDFLRFGKGEVLPMEKRKWLCKDNVCKVTGVKYQFPFCPKKYKGPLNILMKITLQAVEMDGAEEVNEADKTFSVTYFPSELGEFLIPRKEYLKSVNLAQNLVKETQINIIHNGEQKQVFLSEITPKEEGPFPDAHWGSLRVVEQSEEGYSLRKPRGEKNVLYMSPWEVVHTEKSSLFDADEEMEVTKPMIDRILNDIELLYKNNTDRYEVFMADVDKKVFFDYLSVVSFEMNIQEIQKRLEHIYYRHTDAIIADIQLISYNCDKYNDPTSIISEFAKELVERMTLIVQGKVDHEAWKPSEPLVSQLTNAKPEINTLKKAKPEPEGSMEEESIASPAKPSLTQSISMKIEKEKEKEKEEEDNNARMTLRPKRPVRYRPGVVEYEQEEAPRESSLRSSGRLGLRSSIRKPGERDNMEVRGRDTELVLTRHSTRLRSKRTLGDEDRDDEREREREREMKLEEREYEAFQEEDLEDRKEDEDEYQPEIPQQQQQSIVEKKEEENKATGIVINVVRREVGRSLRSERNNNWQYFVVDSLEEEKKPITTASRPKTATTRREMKVTPVKEEVMLVKEELGTRQDSLVPEPVSIKQSSAMSAVEEPASSLPIKQEVVVKNEQGLGLMKEEAEMNGGLESDEVLAPAKEEHREVALNGNLIVLPKMEEIAVLKEEEKSASGDTKENVLESEEKNEEEGGRNRRSLRRSGRNPPNFYNETRDEGGFNGVSGEEKEGDYKRRLRNPGRHLAHLYTEPKDIEEEGLNRRSERPKRKAQADRLQIKLQLQDNMVYQEGGEHEDHEEEEFNGDLEGKTSNGHGVEHPKPVLDEFEAESSTKVRLVLPKGDEKVLPESQMAAKRYNTRNTRSVRK